MKEGKGKRVHKTKPAIHFLCSLKNVPLFMRVPLWWSAGGGHDGRACLHFQKNTAIFHRHGKCVIILKRGIGVPGVPRGIDEKSPWCHGGRVWNTSRFNGQTKQNLFDH